jgi:lipid-A-disaccharide synthase
LSGASRVPELITRRDIYRRLRLVNAPLFIGIDAPDFNLGLEGRLKRRGVRTMHYVSPSVWAWRRERIDAIARGADRLLALFPFEPALYENAKLAVTFVGHPLAAAAATASTRRETRDLLKLEWSRPVFALLPGSRMGELEMHTELLLKTAAEIFEAQPEARFVVPLVSREAREFFERVQYQLQFETLPMTLLYGHADHALRAADVGVVASGTATLEAAMSGCPHIVFYRVNPVTASIVKRKLLLPYVGLPNILVGRFVVAEFLQDQATMANLARATLNLRRYRHAPPARAAVCRHGEDACRRYCDPGGRRGHDGIAHGGRGVLIAGVDEAGRGPLAGPVVAAAVILHPSRRIPGLRDSKLLTARERERLAIEIRMYAVAWAVAESDVGGKSTRSIFCRRRCLRCGVRSGLPSGPTWCGSTASIARRSLTRRADHRRRPPDCGDRRGFDTRQDRP